MGWGLSLALNDDGRVQGNSVAKYVVSADCMFGNVLAFQFVRVLYL